MRILTIALSDDGGGASRAAYRLHKAFCHQDRCKMLVAEKRTHDPTVTSVLPTRSARLIFRAKNRFAQACALLARQGAASENYISLNLAPLVRLDRIDDADHDAIHIHWAGSELVDLSSASRSRKPVFFTMHDMWIFTGAAHLDYRNVLPLLPPTRPRLEYSRSVDWLNRKLLMTRVGHVSAGIRAIITPSQWIADRYTESIVGHTATVHRIRNAVDESVKDVTFRGPRTSSSLNEDGIVLAFGANNIRSYLKGWWLLREALCYVTKEVKTTLITFGDENIDDAPIALKHLKLGRQRDIRNILSIYANADCVVVPSILENSPNTVVEAHVAGTPVAAYSIGGISELISNGITGYLADPFCPKSLAAAIVRAAKIARSEVTRNACRNAAALGRSEDIAQQHLDVFSNLCG